MIKFIKYWLRNAFGVSKTEANGFVILLILLLAFLFVPTIIAALFTPSRDFSKEEYLLDSLVSEMEFQEVIPEEKYQKKEPVNDRYKTTQSYDKKAYKTYEKTSREPYVPKKSHKREVPKPFDLNAVDTTTLKQLRGIGSVLSSRIVKFRDALGGFVNEDQLAEVYGLDDEVIANLDTLAYVSPDFSPQQLSINKATAKELAAHPYVSWQMAKALVNYRQQHGAYEHTNSLYALHLLDTLTIARLAPYLKF